MSSSGFFCLMLSGPGLNADIRNRLMMAATKMNVERISRLPVRCQYFEGVVTTRFDQKVIGGISGIFFEAEIETSSPGKTRLSFIAPVSYLMNTNHENQPWLNTRTGEVEFPEKTFLGYDPSLHN